MKIGRRIKQLRTDRSLTQKDLSQSLNLTPKMISFYENGERIPPADILIKLADIFEVSTDYLLGLTNSTGSSFTRKSDENISTDRLLHLMEEYDLTEESLSKMTRIAQPLIHSYLSGEEMPGAYDLCKIIEILDTSADYLFGKADIPHHAHNEYYGNVLSQRIAHEMDGNYLEAELAEKLDVPISSIKSVLEGEISPSADLLFQLSQIFQKSTDYLLGLSEKSRCKDIDGVFPFFFSEEISKRITHLMESANMSDEVWADLLSISDDEVVLLKTYGFVIHISVLIKLADALNVSLDYLTGKTNAQKTLQKSEESLLIAYRNLNEENQSIAYGEVLKLKKDQEREEYMRSATSVAADEVSQGTGTDGLGK